MEQSRGRESDLIVDLESGGNTSEEEGYNGSNIGVNQTKKLCAVSTGFLSFNGLVKGKEGGNVCSGLPRSVDISIETAELLGADRKFVEGQENVGFLEKRPGRERPRKDSKKPPKPPLPPRSQVLDPADQKLIREISESALLKRARLERIKALKKMKASKAASFSSSNSLCAMIITLLFCLIMILQVM